MTLKVSSVKLYLVERISNHENTFYRCCNTMFGLHSANRLPQLHRTCGEMGLGEH